MKTYRGKGERLDYSNTGAAIASGDVVVIGSRIGIVVNDIAATTGTGELEVLGVHNLPAASADTWDQGAQLYWDALAVELVSSQSSGDVAAGYAAAAKTNGQTSNNVNINR